jgi:hypothetical protein
LLDFLLRVFVSWLSRLGEPYFLSSIPEAYSMCVNSSCAPRKSKRRLSKQGHAPRVCTPSVFFSLCFGFNV